MSKKAEMFSFFFRYVIMGKVVEWRVYYEDYEKVYTIL